MHRTSLRSQRRLLTALIVLLIVGMAMFVMVPVARAGNTITVTTNSVGPGSQFFCPLTAAIKAANSGGPVDFCNSGTVGADIINFAANVSGTITLNSDLDAISDNLTILGGSNHITINANGHRPFKVNSLIVFNVSDITVTNAITDFGGGLYNFQGNVTLTNTQFLTNSAQTAGGAIYNLGGTVNIINGYFFGNAATQGGAIKNYFNATTNITSSTFVSNTAGFHGGAISNEIGQVSMISSTIQNNLAGNNGSTGEGGGIANYYGGGGSSAITIIQSTISGNRVAGGSEAQGGGIHNLGGSSVSDTAILNIYNSTISANTVISPSSPSSGGGGIYSAGQSTVTMNNSTIANNSGGNSGGGGIFADGNQGGEADYSFGNTIIAGNTTSGIGPDCYRVTGSSGASIASTGHSLIQNASGCVYSSGGSGGTIAGANPLLGALANNGGPTLTHALLGGSPAINAGDDAACFTSDQRGTHRPIGAHCDMGAFEAPVYLQQFLPLIMR